MDVVISEKRAKTCMVIAWLYSIMLALIMLVRLYVDFFNEALEISRMALTNVLKGSYKYDAVNAISILITIFLVIVLQIATYWRLKKRINVGVGSANASQGLNSLYTRALKKSTIVAGCFTVGWAPLCVFLLSEHWANENYAEIKIRLGSILMALALLQGLSNAIIFRAKYLRDQMVKLGFTCLQ